LLSITLFSRKDCHLCEDVIDNLSVLQEKFPHHLYIIDVDDDPEIQTTYGDVVPIVEVGPYTLRPPIVARELEVALGAAYDRQQQLEEDEEKSYKERKKRAKFISRGDRFAQWFSYRYMLVFNLFVLIYVGLPFLAPVLLKAGVETPAVLIYKVYSGLCHQLSYRSWFLFGEQPLYPREIAGVDGYLSFHQATGLDEHGLNDARNFLGTPEIGYKIALCQRDVAIYLAILIFGILFVLTNRKIKPLPFLAWVVIGIAPIGFDGGSQILSQVIADPFFSFLQPYFEFLPLRESTPILRSITGFLFGFMTAWFGYPYVEEAMAETRKMLAVKFARLDGSKEA